MSSPSSGPYKSHVFNFLHQLTRRWKEKSDRTGRHVQVAAVWGAQILLYPIYLLTQSARYAGHQLRQAAEKGWPQLNKSKPSQSQTPATSDTPIQRVLAVVTREICQTEKSPASGSTLPTPKVASHGFANKLRSVLGTADAGGIATLTLTNFGLLNKSDPESIRQSEAIRGVASLLSSRTLVLVTTQNQILDILTPLQQQQLSSKISWEVADYWRHRRLMQESQRQFTSHALSAQDDRRLFPVVRLFWKVMAWVQTGSVAIAANLFQESTLVRSQQTEAIPFSSLILAPLSFIVQQLTLLDRTVAEWQTKKLPPASELTSALALRSQAWLQRIQQSVGKLIWQETPPQPTAFSDASETDNLRIHSLIQRAIDYFFGSRGSKLPSTGFPEQQAIASKTKEEINRLQGRQSACLHSKDRPNPELTTAAQADPWLTLSDLFGESATPKAEIQQSSKGEKQQANQLTKTLARGQDVSVGNSIKSQLQRYLSPAKISLRNPKTSSTGQPGNQRKTPSVTKSHKATPVAASVSKQEIRANSTPSAILTPSIDANVKHAPDWIETQATPMGYVKHPLEILLEWLDRAMLWLEEMVVKVWRWVQSLR